MDFLFPFCNIAIHKTTPKFVNCAIYFIYLFYYFSCKAKQCCWSWSKSMHEFASFWNTREGKVQT